MALPLRLLGCLAAGAGALSCGRCNRSQCNRLPRRCRRAGQFVKDVCGCCDVCAKQRNEKCGGQWEIHGKCASGLNCVKRSRDPFAPGICKPSSCVCPAIYSPVCGTDGKTYSNACLAGCKNVRLAYRGSCKLKPICACPRIYRPVCGTNGKTYPNSCNARCNRARVAYNGTCRPARYEMPAILQRYYRGQQQILITPARNTYLVDQDGYAVTSLRAVLKKNMRRPPLRRH